MSTAAVPESVSRPRILGIPIPGKLGRSKFGRAVLVLSSGTALAQILTAAASPLLTRIYTPEDFGTFAIFNSVLMWVLIASCLRYEQAIPVVETEEEVANVAGASLISLVVVSVLTAGGVYFLANAAAGWTGDRAIANLLWVLPFAVFFSGLYQILNYWALREKAHSEVARTRVTQTLIQLVVQIVTGFFVKGPLGLIVGGAIGRSAGSGRFLRKLPVAKQLKLATWPGIVRIAKREWTFPCYSMPGSILHAAGFHLPPLLLAAYFSPQVAGWFSLQERVLGIPLTFLAQAVAQAFYAEAARVARENPRQLKVLFVKTLRNMLVVGILPIGALGLSGPYLFDFVFGDNWRMAGVYAQMLCVVTLLRFCVGPVFYVLTILRKQALQIVADGIGLVVLIGGFVAAKKFDWDPSRAILVYGASTFLVYSLLLLFSWKEVNREAKTIAAEAGKKPAALD